MDVNSWGEKAGEAVFFFLSVIFSLNVQLLFTAAALVSLSVTRSLCMHYRLCPAAKTPVLFLL